MAGRVVVLNGGSSSGKTGIARALQAELGTPWLLFGLDLFMWTLPSRLVGDPSGLSVDKGTIVRGAEFMRLYSAFQDAIATLARHGVNVVIDDVFLDAGGDQERWSLALGDLDVCWVGVKCTAGIAEQRERARGDRIEGAARVQADAVHEGVDYDVEVDTGEPDRARSAALVIDHVRRRWPDLGSDASDPPYSYPLTSAWAADGSIAPAPWERRPSR